MNKLPDFVQNAIERAAADGVRGVVVVGYVEHCYLSWTAEIDAAGTVIGGTAKICTQPDHDAWAAKVRAAAARTGERLMVLRLRAGGDAETTH